MTIYTLELMDPESLKRLPSISELSELCLFLCSGILDFLTEHILIREVKRKQEMVGHMAVMKQSIKSLGESIPGNPRNRHPIVNLHVCIKKQIIGANVVQEFKMNTLLNVHPTILVEIMDKLLENGLICMKPHFAHSFTKILFCECMETIRTVVQDLYMIVPARRTHLKPTSIVVTVEFEDQRVESVSLVEH
jgi:hypothetical protein